MDDREKVKDLIRKGILFSGQGSYSRRWPREEAITYFLQAQEKAEKLAAAHPNDVIVLGMLLQCHEALLDYSKASNILESYMHLTGRTRENLKKLARYREAQKFWSTIKLSPHELSALGEYISSNFGRLRGERSLVLTREWIDKYCYERGKEILNGLAEAGAYSDFQVFNNVALG